MPKCLKILFFYFSFVCVGLCQQLCEGNLGENIFLDGDFGNGEDDILQQNPQIAPGYSYTTGVPPDGSYSILKNTNSWPGLWNTWLRFSDAGNDPDGYMMVINASFSPGIFYEKEITGLCPNTIYEFSAEIYNAIRSGATDHSNPNVSFFLDDEELYSTGLIPKTEKWEKYGFSFVTDSNQESLTLSLRNNAPGGIGNDLALDNISFRPCGPKSFIGLDTDERIFLCSDGDPFNIVAEAPQDWFIYWQISNDNINWTDLEDFKNSKTFTHSNFDANTYFYRYVSAANEGNLDNPKCRIFSDVVGLEVLPEIYIDNDTLCQGNYRVFGDSTFMEPGFHVHTFISSLGCDSTVHLNLVVESKRAISIDYFSQVPICFGDENGRITITGAEGGYPPYELGVFQQGEHFTNVNELSGGSYFVKAIDRHGCRDSILVSILNPDKFFVDLSNDTTIRLGDELSISVATNYEISSYQWTPSGAFPCSPCLEIQYIPTSSNVHKLKAYNELNCIANDSISIEVTAENSIYIPNIFSPNGDGVNDFFILEYYKSSVQELRNVGIFDRHGNAVFRSSSTEKVLWDGQLNGKYVKNGVYVYYIEVVYLSGETEILSGDITLIR